MSSFQVRTSYDVLYDATRATAWNWSVVFLMINLDLMMTKGSQDEAKWGVIDALTDLLGRIEPPAWRQEMR